MRPDPGDRLKSGGADSASLPGSARKRLRLRTDGAARGNPGPAGAGILIEDEFGLRLQARHKWLGSMTNNQAEYHALIEGIKTVRPWKPDELEILLDSKLVVEQIKGAYKIKEPELQRLHAEVMRLLDGLSYEIKHVVREENRGADHLANMAIDAHVPKSKFGG
ncbi:MAG TPA: ribonuclease HI family protein [Candidatus Dormibacteraeota bacterium]|nr:ribonuclease HI family protein [Candidatus Dormibacteraeota bacterium]